MENQKDINVPAVTAEEKDQTKMVQAEKRDLSVPIAIIIAGALVAGAVLYTGSNGAAAPVAMPGQPSQPAPAVDITKVNIDGDPFIGNPNAPVTVAYWMDYQCPFCKRFEQDTISNVVTDYVASGKVKVVFKDFQFLGPDSQAAGLAARAIWETAPDKFYAWHQAMYDKQDAENSGWGNKDDVLALAGSLGIDSAKIEQLMTSKADEYQKEMDADRTEATVFGINGTPGAIIGKNLIPGAETYAQVKPLIDAELTGK